MNWDHIALFNGIGAFQLAAEWKGWNNVASCEIDDFCNKITKYHFSNCKQHGDIKTTDFTIYRGKCDIVTGGFPCQGFSMAGLRLGTEDDRYLWPEYLRFIDEVCPTWVIGENVTGILSMEDKSGIFGDVFAKVENRKVTRFYPIDHYEAIYTRQAKMLVGSICESLEERGYEVQTFALPAACLQAPHTRERIWFIANRNENGCNEPVHEKIINSIHGNKAFDELDYSINGGSFTNPTGARYKNSEENRRQVPIDNNEAKQYRANFWERFPSQSPICDGDDGLSARLDGITFSKWRTESIKAGGNAVVPQLAYEIFKAIEQYSAAAGNAQKRG